MSEQLAVHRMEDVARGALVQRIEKNDEIERGLVAASASRGLVISDDTAALMCAENAGMVAKAIKAVKAAVAEVKKVPRAMERAVDDQVRAMLHQLTTSQAEYGNAKIAWDRELERRRVAAVLAQREEEDKARREAETQAALTGEVVVPLEGPTDLPPVPRMTKAGAAAQVTTYRLTAEVVDHAAAPKEWFDLRTTVAVSWFSDEMRRGKQPTIGNGREEALIVNGVRFWREPHVQTRTT